MTSLPLDVADRIADACLAAGRTSGYAPLTVVILDAGGHPIVLKRGDGSGILRHDIAFGKAWGALGMGLPSRALAKRSHDAPIFYAALGAVSGGRMVPVPGGVLIKNEKAETIGAIGVSGDASDRDEECAVQAVQSVGLVADSAER
jgi:uncharacterized protein GlcG (DUF336 family)